MRFLNRAATVLALLALCACSGMGASGNLSPTNLRGTSGSARALPDEGASALPGEGANALPGEGANALPGSQLACRFSAQQGQASCTIAINVIVSAIPNPNTPASAIPGLHPADLQNAYGLAARGSSGTVAIVDAYDAPAVENDLGVYRNAFGLPACTTSNGCFRKVNQAGVSGAYPQTDAGWSQEIALDVEMVSAICPACKILLVEANSASLDDLGASVDRAASLGAVAISNSYYAYEWSGETAEDMHYHHPGVAVTASSGDAAEPFYPAASPYVTAVGGTSLSANGASWNESAWEYGGRGCSAFEALPAWQSGTPCAKRSTVDLAAVADPQTGVAIFDAVAGGWIVAGGTSVG
ncbi:MAG: hypothetical protein JO347_09510, partial [Candidatus Eremiobacteraeota bacterium]|nr:hypothetical protein [Candidatus Eremiobacteraeota bacterium]